MKKSLIFVGLNVVCCLHVVAQTIALTDFTEHVVNAYLEQSGNTSQSAPVIIHVSNDGNHCLMQIFEDTLGYYDVLGMDLVIFNGIELRVSGIRMPFLFTGDLKQRNLKNNNEYDTYNLNYDPKIWHVALHNDGTLCKMFTYKESSDCPINDLIALSEQYLNGVHLTSYDQEYIYDNIMVDTPAVLRDDKKVQDILEANINLKKRIAYPSVPVVINLIIDKEGRVRVDDFVKKSEDEEVNIEALRLAGIICSYDFEPAKHRGELVQVHYALPFPKKYFCR